MTTNDNRESAKIYTFPLRGRFAVDNQETKSAANFSLPRGSKIAVGGAWYHEEAVRDEWSRPN